MIYDSEKCALCGTAPWEWEEDKYAYEPEERLCQGCYRKQSYNESLGKTLPGTTVELVKMTPQRRAQKEVTEAKRRKAMREG